MKHTSELYVVFPVLFRARDELFRFLHGHALSHGRHEMPEVRYGDLSGSVFVQHLWEVKSSMLDWLSGQSNFRDGVFLLDV